MGPQPCYLVITPDVGITKGEELRREVHGPKNKMAVSTIVRIAWEARAQELEAITNHGRLYVLHGRDCKLLAAMPGAWEV